MPKNIIIKDTEGWDNINEEFTTIKGGTLRIEHSLLSIAKWEAETEKCFLDSRQLTEEEMILYIKCMTLNNVPDRLFDLLSVENISEIKKYMNRKMSAVNFNSNRPAGKRSREQNTAEMIYYQMITLNIPKEFEKWHINRLMVLIQLVSRMNEAASNPKKNKHHKLTSSQISARNELNAARRKQFNTNG